MKLLAMSPPESRNISDTQESDQIEFKKLKKKFIHFSQVEDLLKFNTFSLNLAILMAMP
jgi:hypothetical protein